MQRTSETPSPDEFSSAVAPYTSAVDVIGVPRPVLSGFKYTPALNAVVPVCNQHISPAP